MQESKNCELLFEYLRSILYDAKIETLNIFDLDEPYRKLGQGLQFLENAIGEMKSYSEALSRQNRWQKAITPRRYPIWENSQKHLIR